MTWLDSIADHAALRAVAAAVRQGGTVAVRGAVGSSTSLLALSLLRHAGQPGLLVTAHLDDADEALDELQGLGTEACRFPALEVLPGETAVSLEQLAERLALLRRLRDGDVPPLVVAPVHALMQGVPEPGGLERLMRVLRPGDRVDLRELGEWLQDAGYTRADAVETPGEYAIRGGIIDVFPPSGMPLRIDLFGDEVEGLFEIDLETMGSDRRTERAEIAGVRAAGLEESEASASLLEHLPARSWAVLAELGEISEQGRSYFERAADARALLSLHDVQRRIGERCGAVVEVSRHPPASARTECIELPVGALPAFEESAAAAVAGLRDLAARHRTLVLCQNEGEAQRMRKMLDQFAPDAAVDVQTRYLHRGFAWGEGAPGPGVALVPSHELLHRYQLRRRVRRIAARVADSFLDLEPGDLVVHRDHGIARYLGIRTMRPSGADGAAEEYLTLEFHGRARLHVPASRIELVHRYIGAFQGRPQLARLGGRRWAKQKEDVSEAVRNLAAEMLRIQAARSATAGIRFPADTPWQREFEAEFPYEETEDQLAAAEEVKRDMADPQPMDRLVCGDVGFGKTEVAIRAAFKAAEYGKQVAVLVPTTVLAEQHERTFRERFADYPFRIESLSRFKTEREQAAIIEALQKGHVDIVVGTHRLLSSDVRFADLGLVVIDEEQRFGVGHKQRLLALRMTADVLTLTATPIPRTLHMAMLGLRDISALSTPPLDRRAIVTEVLSFDPQRIRLAIERELAREGQVYYLHNRVQTIGEAADRVRVLAPDARILVGHGQMAARELESVMLRFLRREADVLVCTTIIESGIDIPNVNTIVIEDAHRFGLSELHQLRGRVGRYKHRAYCYLLLPRRGVVSDVAMRRLRAVEQFSMLGAGFKIALRDLEIRGAGNLLGPEQSGHIAAVGYEMYCRLLEGAVADLRNEHRRSTIDTTIDIGVAGALPKGYIPSDVRRLEAYRRLSAAESPAELDSAREDLRSAYGELPAAARALFDLARLRIAAGHLGVRSITRQDRDAVLLAENPALVQPRFAAADGSLRVVGPPDRRGLTTVYYRPPEDRLHGDRLLQVLLNLLAGAAARYPEGHVTDRRTCSDGSAATDTAHDTPLGHAQVHHRRPRRVPHGGPLRGRPAR
jgi:transcription-repair coupling factor (superfamily II helicase)